MVTSDATELPIAAVRRAARNPELLAEVCSLYQVLDRRIAEQAPVCENRGECCRFGRFGHRLFVTGVEAAYFLATQTDEASPEVQAVAAEACPYQVAGRCEARTARPVGCRVFFCDPAAQDWQSEMSEEFLARLRALHERFNVPYCYADWLTVLRVLGRKQNPERATP